MEPFQPQVLSPEEIRAMFTEVSEKEIKQAYANSFIPLSREILFRSQPHLLRRAPRERRGDGQVGPAPPGAAAGRTSY